MNFVRTVLGDIPADQLGVTYAHEHIVIDRSYVTEKTPDFLLEDVDRICLELREFHLSGGRTMVDSMPCGGGRHVAKLAEVSRRTGVHILCPTGLHLDKYYPHGHWRERCDVEAMAEIFINEIELGIDFNDTLGPTLKRSEHRAGLIKIASGLDRIEDDQKAIFEAAAIAHHATGAPILTHTEQGTAGLDQIQLLTQLGVDPSHVVISHLDRKPDIPYHKEVLSTGAFLEYDSAFRWKTVENPTLELVAQLVSDGLAGQIMLGMDAARSSYWRSYGGKPGLCFLLNEFTTQLRSRGLTDLHFRSIFVENPSRAYALALPKSPLPDAAEAKSWQE